MCEWLAITNDLIVAIWLYFLTDIKFYCLCKYLWKSKANPLGWRLIRTISNPWQLDSLFKAFSMLTIKETSWLSISWPLWGESSDRWVLLRKASNLESVFMSWRLHADNISTTTSAILLDTVFCTLLRWEDLRMDFVNKNAMLRLHTKQNKNDDVIKWKHSPGYLTFVRGIHRSQVNSPHKGQWRGAWCFLLSAPK